MLDNPARTASVVEDFISPQDQRRGQILDAARACFSASGFHGASMQEICAAARLSPGALYRYFRSKEAIVEAIAEEERQRAGRVLEGLRGPGPLLERLVASALAYIQAMQDQNDRQLMMEVCAETLRNPQVKLQFECAEKDVHGLLRSVIEDAKRDGEVDAALDVDAVVPMLMAVVDGIVLRLALSPQFDLTMVGPQLTRIVATLIEKRS